MNLIYGYIGADPFTDRIQGESVVAPSGMRELLGG